MGRPRMMRQISSNPGATYYKPQGIPMSNLQEVDLSLEELEALRLKGVLGYDQNRCAEEMKTSQSTFQRILSEAIKKVAQALNEGRAIKIG